MCQSLKCYIPFNFATNHHRINHVKVYKSLRTLMNLGAQVELAMAPLMFRQFSLCPCFARSHSEPSSNMGQVWYIYFLYRFRFRIFSHILPYESTRNYFGLNLRGEISNPFDRSSLIRSTGPNLKVCFNFRTASALLHCRWFCLKETNWCLLAKLSLCKANTNKLTSLKKLKFLPVALPGLTLWLYVYPVQSRGILVYW